VTDRPRVLVVDDEKEVRDLVAALLSSRGYEAVLTADGAEALEAAARVRPRFVLTDLRMPTMDGMQLLDELRRRGSEATVIVMSGFGTFDLAVEAMRRGAYDYVEKPFRNDELVLVLRKAEERERLLAENRLLRRALYGPARSGLVGTSPPMAALDARLAKLAPHKTTVLVEGESGTGKELVARALHRGSPRGEGPFVAVNCGAIPEALLESELFGHVRGAFTDATRDKRGLIEEASSGTLFLDEVGELPLALQAKLLRVLQEERLRPLGATEERVVDVRVVAATVRELDTEVAEGRFREDLYYRLAVARVRMPPLRERRGDIPLLCAHFIRKHAGRLGFQAAPALTAEAIAFLESYAWPGNVRELENVIEHAIVLAEGPELDPSSLPERLRQSEPAPLSLVSAAPGLSIKENTRLLEAELIRRALAQTAGNRTKAVELLEISHRALLYKIKEYGL